jgi:hypothetical protein
MALSLETSRAAAPIDWACNDASEMRGVFELQAMQGFSKTQHPLDGQDLKRFQKDTGEALAKIWRIR